MFALLVSGSFLLFQLSPAHGVDFEISFTPDTLSTNTWDNHGTLGNSHHITDFKQGTVQQMTTTAGESINALCFPAYSGHSRGAAGNGDEFITYINYDTSSASNPELTMEIWIYPTEFNNRDWLLGNWQDGNSRWNDRSIIPFDDRFDGMTVDSSGTIPVDSPMSSPPLNQWTQIVATFSDANSVAKVYKNGGKSSQDVYQTGNVPAAGYPQIGINGLKEYPDYNFVGCVGKIQITNKVLNEQEISDLYDEGLFVQPTCEEEYEAAGYNDGSAIYKYTGGCQQHFEYVLDQSSDLSFSECSAKCLEHKDWCRSFTYGRDDIAGQCNLYGGICTPISDHEHTNVDMFTPILASSATWDFTGMCPQHFKYPLWQDKTGTFSVEECSRRCSVDGSQWCRSFAYGKSDANSGWCNLYGGVCKDDSLANRESSWDFGVPILSEGNVNIIPLYSGRCQEHFQFGLLQDRTGTYTFDMCKDWAVMNKDWCKSFAFGTSDENRNWCNLYGGVCTPQANDFLDWGVFQVRNGINNAQAMCNINSS